MLKKMSDPALDETFVSSKPAFDGRLLHVHVDTVRLPNGRTTTREWYPSCLTAVSSS